MSQTLPAEILRIHISESDRHQGRPLYEAIVAKCRELEIAGATVFRGVEGYGETAEMHRGHLVHSDRPLVVTVVDRAENIQRLIPAVAEMMDTGLMARSTVEMIRVQRPDDPKPPLPRTDSASGASTHSTDS
jgi:PII-like signaling protein